MSGTPVAALAPLTCPSCGAPIVSRTFGRARTVACEQCGTALDPAEPTLARALEAEARATRIAPLLPLGTRGTFRGEALEVVGFMVREIRVDEVPYRWREYLLFHPVHGYRYLTEYDGHWTWVHVLPGAPDGPASGASARARWGGASYRHFQRAQATVVFVIGEFPWVVRVGDTAMVDDYVAPPFGLSAEVSDGEVAWSHAEYVEPGEVREAFRPEAALPIRRGTYGTQPNPAQAQLEGLWRTFVLALLLLLTAALVRTSTAINTVAWRTAGTWTPADTVPFASPVFTLAGGARNVQLRTETTLANQWLYAHFTLVNDETGEAFEVGRDLGYWYGTDSDGSWSEGSRSDEAILGPVPGGRYFLRVELDGSPEARDGVGWQLTVTRDVPRALWWLLGAVALLVPPLVAGMRSASFEAQRWRESDYAPSGE